MDGGGIGTITGSLEDQEYFGEILIGIKQVIHNHLKEMQSNFYEKFIDLEDEVRQRDDLIQRLKNRIHDLETGNVTVYGVSRNLTRDSEGSKDRPGSSNSTGSSNELPFMVSVMIIYLYYTTTYHFSSVAIHLIQYLRHRRHLNTIHPGQSYEHVDEFHLNNETSLLNPGRAAIKKVLKRPVAATTLSYQI